MLPSIRLALRWPPPPAWWRSLRRRGPPRAVAALALGDDHAAVVRVALDPAGGPMRLQHAEAGTPQSLRGWARQRVFAGARPVLVLPAAERHLLPIDDPAVPPHERAMAVRFPLAEALDAEPEELLITAVPMPRVNDAARPQLLAVAARLETVRERLAVLARAGIAVDSIDIADSALRGLSLLADPSADARGGTIVVAMMPSDLSIGLLWRGRFCALRSLALPQRRDGDDAEFVDQVALHVQRTIDHFERQATRLALRDVLALLPELSSADSQAVLRALPLQARAFDPGAAMAVRPAAALALKQHPQLAMLASVAALRLLDANADPALGAEDDGADELSPPSVMPGLAANGGLPAYAVPGGVPFDAATPAAPLPPPSRYAATPYADADADVQAYAAAPPDRSLAWSVGEAPVLADVLDEEELRP